MTKFKKLHLLATSEVLRPILTLGAGAVVAQLIPFVMSFVLARLYTPEDFGELGLFLNYAGILIIIASARYDLAIVRARSDDEAFALSALSLCISLAFCCLLWLVAVVSDFLPCNYVSQVPSKYLLPFCVMLSVLFQVLANLHNYYERYKSIARMNVVRNIVQAIARLLLSLQQRVNGLVWGVIAGFAGACLVSLRVARSVCDLRVSTRRLYCAARRYANFPKYVLPSSLLNTLSTNLPVILFALFFDECDVGYFTMTTTLLYLPVSLLGSSIGQVFYKKSAVWELPKVCDFAWQVLCFSGILSLVAYVVIMLSGRHLFAFLLGEEWRVIGDYATILLPWFVLVLCFSPLSMIFDAKDKQRTEMCLNITAFVGRTVAVLACGHASFGAEQVVLAYCLSSVAVWMAEGVIIFRILGMPRRKSLLFFIILSLALFVWGGCVWSRYV